MFARGWAGEILQSGDGGRAPEHAASCFLRDGARQMGVRASLEASIKLLCHAQAGGCVTAGAFLGALTVLHASPARRELWAVCASQPSDAAMAQSAAAHGGRLLICVPALACACSEADSASPCNFGSVILEGSCLMGCLCAAAQSAAHAMVLAMPMSTSHMVLKWLRQKAAQKQCSKHACIMR